MDRNRPDEKSIVDPCRSDVFHLLVSRLNYCKDELEFGHHRCRVWKELILDYVVAHR